MSAAFDNLKKGWLTILLSFFLTVITIAITQAVSSSEFDSRDLKEELKGKADKEYVDDRIEEHEKQDAARYKGIQDMFFITNERLKEIQQDVRAIRK